MQWNSKEVLGQDRKDNEEETDMLWDKICENKKETKKINWSRGGISNFQREINLELNWKDKPRQIENNEGDKKDGKM